jgi:IS30 family transposase
MAYKHFSVEEREKIEKGIWDKQSIRSIATELGRSHSSVLREIKRHNPQQPKRYVPRLAQARALERRKSRGRKDRLKNERIRSYVKKKLKEGWSPEQIANTITDEYPKKCISHEAIYQYIYVQVNRNGWGELKPQCEDLRPYLRRKRKRRQKHGMRRAQRIFRPRGTSIDERPKVVGKRRRIGDWESDTVESRDHKPGVNTLLERKTGLFFITKVRDKTAEATVIAIESRLSAVPKDLRHTLTLDNGPENSDWKSIEEKTNIKTYFAHPYHSWERGSNENANGLLREYFPKGTNFGMISDEEIQRVERKLNSRPRKRLGYKTPLQVWSGAFHC